ncbi:MAG: methyltransferase family protein, partial [Deferrisomatales bacterium]
ETTWFFRNVVRRRVAGGFVLAAAFVVFAGPTRASVFWGFWLALAGEALRTWASGTIVKNEELTTDGPYCLTRNPLYLGNFLIGLGVAVMGGRALLVALFLLFFLPVYHALIRKEESRLLERYTSAFEAYCAGVPRFFPNLKAWPPPAAPYDPRRMWSVHREWRAWLGLYAVTLFLMLASR